MTAIPPLPRSVRLRSAPLPRPLRALRGAGAGILLAVALLLLPGPARSQTPPESGPAVPTEAALADLAWMEGSWQARPAEGVLNETILMAPRAGVMTGVMRLSRDGALLIQEMIAIVEREDGIAMIFRHFGTGLEAQEEEPIVLALTELSDGRAVFRGPWSDGFITSVARRTGEDSWSGRSEITSGGRTTVMENRFVRAGPADEPADAPDSGAPQVVNTSYVGPDGRRVQQLEVVVPASPEEVWEALTTSEGFSSWAVPAAWVDFRVGGIMETSYDAGARRGDPENIRNRIQAYVPGRMLAIQAVQAPSGFPHAELLAELVTVIEIEALGPGRVRVRESGVGYGPGEGWDTLYRFFERGNRWTLEQLHRRFTEGPTDWSELAPPGGP